MRRNSFGLAVTIGLIPFALAACGGDEVKPQPVVPQPEVTTTPPPVEPAPPPVEAPKPTLAELQKKTTEGIGQALNAHDAKKVASFYTESAVVRLAGMPDLTGREAIAAMWQKNFDASSSSKSMASRVLMKDDIVVVEWVWAGTQTGEMMGVKATEKPIGAIGADVMWFSPDGLVKEQHTYFDMSTIMSQIGASKQKGRAVPAMPAGVPQVVVSTNGAEEKKNVDTVKTMWGAFEKKNDADFLNGAADDIAWDDVTMPEPMKGKAAGKKFFGEITKAFPDLKAAPTNAWGIGDFVVAEGTMSGTHKGAFMGIPATKKAINLHGLDIAQFNKEGKLVKGTSYGNGLEMAMQLGLVPPPGKDPKAAPAKPATPATPAKPATPAAKPATPATPATPAKK